MMLAIHHRPGSFSDRWLKYCQDEHIEYKLINCYDNDIIQQLRGCDALMWHWDHNDYKAMLFARELTMVLSYMGIKIYPNVQTSWHFDDKLGQKYLLEAIKTPMAASYAFFSKRKAKEWAANTQYPKIFKLRGGAGSINVRMVRNSSEAIKLINRAFGKGFRHSNRWTVLKDKVYTFKMENTLSSFIGIFKGMGRLFIPTDVERMSGRQKGYIYFQDFLPENDYDVRLVVIGEKCFGVRRFNRKNDFRASGSGNIDNNKDFIDIKCVRLAFEIAGKIESQSLAIDFLKYNNEYKLVEVSYCFPANLSEEEFQGYWDNNFIWHGGKVISEKIIFNQFLNSFKNSLPESRNYIMKTGS